MENRTTDLDTNEMVIRRHMLAYGLSEWDLLPGERERVLEMYKQFRVDVKKFDLVADECALIIIDMQNHFVDPKGGSWCPEALRQVPKIKELTAYCRNMKIPVFYTQFHYDMTSANLYSWRFESILSQKRLFEGTWGAKIFPDLLPDKDDIVISKHTPDCFVGTDLDYSLRDLKVKSLVICGTNTDICCETTARSAFCLHYNVAFGSDICSTYFGESHDATLAVMRFAFARVMTQAEIIREINGNITR